LQIKRIHIENFRSIRVLDFEPGPYCVLIGENNAGKSNLLRALNLVLGETWPSERSFSEEDFHDQDTSQDIVIQVFFDETTEEWRNNFRLEIGGLELRCKAYKRRVKGKPAGSLATDYVCLQPSGKPAQVPSQPLKKGERHQGAWLPQRVSRDIRERMPFIYVDVHRDYGRQSPSSRWSVLRRLFNEVNLEFLNDKKEVDFLAPDGSTQRMTRREAFESSVKAAYAYLRTEHFAEIEERLAANAMEQMGLDPEGNAVELHFEAHDPTNAFRSLQLYVDQMGIRSPAGEVGAGLQSAIVVAIFRTYEELKKEGAVFALEEPEVFLHPQRARYFAQVLRSLAERGNQVFVSTHSPVFVQLDQPETVALVRRTQREGTRVHQAKRTDLADDDRRALRLLTEFDTQRGELFFARSVLLVEGGTEKLVMPLVFRALGHDLNRLGISVVEVGGKTKLPLFVRVCRALDIPVVVLVDHDVREIGAEWSAARQEREEERNARHKRWNQAIEEAVGDWALFWMRPDFEAEAGLPRDDAEKLDRALEHFHEVGERNIPEVLVEAVRATAERVS